MSHHDAVDKLVHDTRASLNSITMNAELVKMLLDKPGAPGADLERIPGVMDTIIRQCRDCNTVVEKYRHVAKKASE